MASISISPGFKNQTNAGHGVVWSRQPHKPEDGHGALKRGKSTPTGLIRLMAPASHAPRQARCGG